MDSDAQARLCAIACGHAMGAGAACCPMQEGSLGLTMTPCTPDDSPGATPVPASQPAILLTMGTLAVPQRDASAFAFAPAPPRAPDSRPPDHVPLRLS